MSERQPISKEISTNSSIPFLDSAWMKKLKERVYKQTEPTLNGEISPSSKYCFSVNLKLQEILKKDEEITADYIEYEDQYTHRGVVTHAFVSASYEGSNYLLDMQYQQFIPEEKRKNAPDYLVIKYANKHDVISGLIKHDIPNGVHTYWTDELFPQPEPSLFQ